MNDTQIRRLATAGVLAAAIFLMTAFFRIPIGAGYLNFGDFGVFFAALLLPSGYAALCAGIGSALADLYGYPLYAPVTLVIKALAALTFGLLWRRLSGKAKYLAFLAVLVIPLGYFVYELVIAGTFAWADLPWNLLQSAIGAALAFAVDRLTKGRFVV